MKTKQLISAITAIALILTIIPLTAAAEPQQELKGSISGNGWTYECEWGLLEDFDIDEVIIIGNLKITTNEGMTSWKTEYETKVQELHDRYPDNDFSEDIYAIILSIEFGEDVTEIPDFAFVVDDHGLPNVTEIIIPDKVTKIGERAFLDFERLETVTIGKGVTSIGASAFENNSVLTTLTIAGNITDMGLHVFQYCPKLSSVIILEGVTTIGNGMFLNCDTLTSIEIPDTVTTIGEYAFENCKALTSVTLPVNQEFKVIAPNLFKESGLTEITIPSSVTEIATKAFLDCTDLKSITIPSSVTKMGATVFDGCTNLGAVIFEGATPPSDLDVAVFTNMPTDCIVYVPTGATAAYTADTAFSGRKIVELPLTVTFNSQSGSAVTAKTVTEPMSLITAPTPPTRSGYGFDGWYKEAACTTPWNFSTDTVRENVTLYAKWINYTITATASPTTGGTVSGGGSFAPNASVALTATPNNGYSFDGWYESGTKITNAGATYTFTATANRTLQARFTSNTYDITYNLNSGTGDTTGNYTYATGLTLPTPTRDGYTFGGWFDNEDFTGTAVTAISATDTGDKEFWAKWADTISPTGEITISGQPFTSYDATVEFNLFFDSPQTVTIEGEDAGSGVKTIEYQIRTTAFTDEDEAKDDDNWILYDDTKKPTLPQKSKGIVYARITDNNGNVTVISSTGLVVYTDMPQTISGVYQHGSGEPFTVNIPMHGNTVKSITVNGITSVAYDVGTDTITFPTGTMSTLGLDADSNDVNYTLEIEWNPLGATATPTSGSDPITPTTLTIRVTPRPVNTVTVNVNDPTMGTAFANPVTAAEGDTVTLTATAETGYKFDSWTVVSGGVTLTGNSFIMGDSPVVITAEFVVLDPCRNGHDFNYTSDNNATCTQDGTETATCSRCTVTNTRTVEDSKLPHTPKVANCTECEDCDAVLERTCSAVSPCTFHTPDPEEPNPEEPEPDPDSDNGGGSNNPINSGRRPTSTTNTTTASNENESVTGTEEIIIDVPKAVIEEIAGNLPTTQIAATSAGTQLITTAAANAGQNAVLLVFNEETGEFEVVSAATVGTDGTATVNIPGAGDYIVVVAQTGDLTGTGNVTAADALLLLQALAGNAELNPLQKFLTSSRSDSKFTATDALNILKFVTGMIDEI
ncbi:MAG: leucine-rich repeat protein [Oscillospiraceae bacterium]|nr:leucine-rich repeat protein [Oscillospiraceae bacterium]